MNNNLRYSYLHGIFFVFVEEYHATALFNHNHHNVFTKRRNNNEQYLNYFDKVDNWNRYEQHTIFCLIEELLDDLDNLFPKFTNYLPSTIFLAKLNEKKENSIQQFTFNNSICFNNKKIINIKSQFLLSSFLHMMHSGDINIIGPTYVDKLLNSLMISYYDDQILIDIKKYKIIKRKNGQRWFFDDIYSSTYELIEPTDNDLINSIIFGSHNPIDCIAYYIYNSICHNIQIIYNLTSYK